MIRGNDIDTVPETISQLDQLKTLRIENCELNKLPKTLNQMLNLKYLGLCETKLTDLNPDLFPKNLKEINLSGSRRYKDDDFENLKRTMKRTKI
jgi:Leucine-rich repeat (LRR) protein